MTNKRGAFDRTSRAVDLDPAEEKVIRMSRGIGAPDDVKLEMRGRGNPETWARLREIENRAFEKSGRLDALRKEALEASDTDEETKERIVARLKEHSSDGGARQAEALAKAGARKGKKSGPKKG